MCHHYKGSRNPPEHLCDEFSIRTTQALAVPHLFEELDYWPLAIVPVIRLDDAGERELVPMEWGLLPFWWKPSDRATKRSSFQRKTINARSEDVDKKPTYREAFKRRHCLMPAGEFFERGHYFRFADDRPFAFAALWESWRGGEGEDVESCTLLTTEPNELVRSVGHHRMPVLLSSEAEYQLWMSPEQTGRKAVEHLFSPTDAAIMVCRPK
jgi:putative SOS response-associated peptidase YedK